jgi:LCP family protein required for cell wall assembly
MDRPRVRHPALAAALSFLFPGLGQAYAGQAWLAVLLAAPVLLLAVAVIIALAIATDGLRNTVLSTSFLQALLLVDLVLRGWRMFAIAEVGLARPMEPSSLPSGDPQPSPPARWLQPSPVARIGFVILLLGVTVAMHAYVFVAVRQLDATLQEIFGGSTPSGAPAAAGGGGAAGTPAPVNRPDYHWNGTERINILLLGVDAGPGRPESLTDTILVVSVDPVARTAAMISIPRDTGFVPLPSREIYADARYPNKINQLSTDAGAAADRWCPDLSDPAACGLRSLERAVGLYLGIEIQYYAQGNLQGFARLIDPVGGVTLCLDGDLVDATYTDPSRPHRMGITLPAGCRRYNGTDALAYARIRKGYLQLPDGTRQPQNDFKRAARQQEVLLALRNEFATSDLIFALPNILDAIGRTVTTDFPRDKAGDLASLLPLITGPDIERVVLDWPDYVDLPTNPEVNYLLLPKRNAIRTEMEKLFGKELLGWYLGSTASGPSRPPEASASPGAAAR